MHNTIWCPIYIPSFMIIGSVVSEELRWQDFGTDGRTDRRTDGVTALLDLLSPSAPQVKKHPKYLIFGERLLLNVAGGTSERMIHHLVWERTVNVTGGKRKKHSKGPPLWTLNMQYKENSRDAIGQLTSNTVNRHSQMLWIGKNIQSIFNEQVVFKPYRTRKHGNIDRKEDIRRMVKTLQPLHYISQEEGRAFKGFESFTPIKGVRFPKKFKECFIRHLKKTCQPAGT